MNVPKDAPQREQVLNAQYIWFSTLKDVNRDPELGWNLTSILPLKGPNLGRFPSIQHVLHAAYRQRDELNTLHH